MKIDGKSHGPGGGGQFEFGIVSVWFIMQTANVVIAVTGHILYSNVCKQAEPSK